MRREEGTVAILFEEKSTERRTGKLFWNVLGGREFLLWVGIYCLADFLHKMGGAGRKYTPFPPISFFFRQTTNLGSRGNMFLAKSSTVKEGARGKRSKSSAFVGG